MKGSDMLNLSNKHSVNHKRDEDWNTLVVVFVNRGLITPIQSLEKFPSR